jgi:hypothetical protein
LLERFGALHAEQLELFYVNIGEIILLLKINEVGRIQLM